MDQDFVLLQPGIEKRIIKEGTGEMPSEGDVVRVHYTGNLLDGTKFDSSRDRDEPFQFTLGKGQVIKGWDVGVKSMSKNEVAELKCAPECAYGEKGSPPTIPPNSTLSFHVELIDFEHLPQTDQEKVEYATVKKEQAGQEFRQQNFDKAEKLYEQGLKMVSKIDSAKNLTQKLRSNLSLCYLKTKQYRKVLQVTDELIAVNSDDAKALFRRALALKGLNCHEEAFGWIKKVAELSPNDALVRQAFMDIKSLLYLQRKQEKDMYAKMLA